MSNALQLPYQYQGGEEKLSMTTEVPLVMATRVVGYYWSPYRIWGLLMGTGKRGDTTVRHKVAYGLADIACTTHYAARVVHPVLP
jgi:hypothetical protein